MAWRLMLGAGRRRPSLDALTAGVTTPASAAELAEDTYAQANADSSAWRGEQCREADLASHPRSALAKRTMVGPDLEGEAL